MFGVFRGFFDESTDQDQKKIYVIGGFVGRYEEWAKIEWRWKELLEKYGLGYYRAAEAEHARKQFDKLPFRDGDKPLTYEQFELLRGVRDEFLSVFCAGLIAGVAIGIHIDDFNAVANTPELLAKFGNTPYFLCGHVALLSTIDGVKNHIRSKELVAFIFDRQEKYDAEMLRVHSRFTKADCEFHSQVGSLTFEDKRRFVPLQVADTLAYEVRKDFENRIANPDAPERAIFTELKERDRVWRIHRCDQPCLQWYLENLE